MSTQQVQLDFGSLLGEAWGKLSSNLVNFVVAIIILAAITLGLQFIPIIGTLASFIIGGPLALGIAHMSLHASRGERVEIGQLFSGFNQFVPAALAGVIVNILVMIGMILCVVPGIVVGALYMFTFFFMASGVNNFWSAMESSRIKVSENLMAWFMLALILFGINIVGLLLVGVGLLVTMPLSWVVLAITYDRYLNVNVDINPTVGDEPIDGGQA